MFDLEQQQEDQEAVLQCRKQANDRAVEDKRKLEVSGLLPPALKAVSTWQAFLLDLIKLLMSVVV